MASLIVLKEDSYYSQRVSLSNSLFNLTFKFNSVNKSWYIDISSVSGRNKHLTGLMVVPNQNLTGRYLVDELSGGNLWCIKNSNTKEPLGFDNFGDEKDYRLYWIPSNEEKELGINEFIQL
jgi:hypothetical protein